MSVETLMDTITAGNYFCSICLRTKAEVKLDPISTKMYQMFFIELVKCVDSTKVTRSICVWCRQRVVNALRLVETAQTSNRILTNISLRDKLQSQTSQQIVLDEIQAAKQMAGLTARISQVTSCNILPDSSVKPELEDSIFNEEGDVCLDNVCAVSRQTFPSSAEMKCNKDETEQIQTSEENYTVTSETSRVISCSSLPDTAVGLSVKLECEDEICDEDGNVCHKSVIDKGELDRKDVIALEGHDYLELKVEVDIDNELNTEFNIEENPPRLHEDRKQNKRKSNAVTKKKMKRKELNEIMQTNVPNLESFDAGGNQKLLYEIEIEKPGSEFLVQNFKNASQEINSQTAKSSVEALKHIHLLHLTEAQRLQELEERRQGARYRNSSFKCNPCALNFTSRKTYESHMKRHAQSFGSHRCPMCNVYFKKKWSYQQHCKEHYERYMCTMCGHSSSHRETAIDHYVSQHTNQRFKCKRCMREFKWASGLRHHMKVAHVVERPHFSCPHCNQVLKSRNLYNVHMEQHNSSKKGDEPYSHGCEVCSQTFSTASLLRQHQETHSNKKTFPCQSCQSNFKSWTSLNKHKRMMHPEVCFECDYCKKIFGFKEDLRKHITWTHLGLGYNCQFCSKVFSFKFLLERHIKQEHDTTC